MIYVEKPDGFAPDFSVAGVFVESKGEILQLLRVADRKIEPMKWGSPAGRIESGEDARTTTLRELKEETGLLVFSDQLVFVQQYFVEYPDCKFTYDVFRLLFPHSPEIILSHEHVAKVWIPPAFASSLDLMTDEWECICLVYGLAF